VVDENKRVEIAFVTAWEFTTQGIDTKTWFVMTDVTINSTDRYRRLVAELDGAQKRNSCIIGLVSLSSAHASRQTSSSLSGDAKASSKVRVRQ
jgi:hypothetical protein